MTFLNISYEFFRDFVIIKIVPSMQKTSIQHKFTKKTKNLISSLVLLGHFISFPKYKPPKYKPDFSAEKILIFILENRGHLLMKIIPLKSLIVFYKC